MRQIVLGTLLLAGCLWGAQKRADFGEELLISLAVIIGLTVFYLLAFCRRVGEPSRLLLTHRGLRFESPTLDRGWIEWPHIQRAEYHWLSGVIRLIGVNGERLLTTRSERLGSRELVRECVAAINDRRRRYRLKHYTRR